MKAEKPAAIGRRDVLRTLGLGAGVAVATAAPLATEAVADTENASERTKSRYKETDHVKAFYRVNRYPTK